MNNITAGQIFNLPHGGQRGQWRVMATTGHGSAGQSAWLQRLGSNGAPLTTSRDRMNVTEQQINHLMNFLK